MAQELFHLWLYLQLMEDLEQLKVLENGYKIKVITVDHCAHGVDEPHDIASIEAKIQELQAQATPPAAAAAGS